MNRIILIGNGFDLAHGLPTRYEDFINWYWEKRVMEFNGNLTPISEDCLCSFNMTKSNSFRVWNVFAFDCPRFIHKIPGKDIVAGIISDTENYKVSFSPFFKNICDCIESKGWVDIEREYYTQLKHTVCEIDNKHDSVKSLNEQLIYIRNLLAEYLQSLIYGNNKIKEILSIIYENFKREDISVERKDIYRDYFENNSFYSSDGKESGILFSGKHCKPSRVLLLNFNYTPVAVSYSSPEISNLVYIHGTLSNPDKMIFGYGDELDENYKKILNEDDNEFLRNIKSIKYLESSNYRRMLEFIETEPYQIYIMGHSCGNSDRTLLNTLFEHKNCVSIKPYFYQKEDGSDNYLEIVQNICRNFTDMKLMRDRVVNKTYCEPLPQFHK